jgi:ribonuclease Z
VGFIYVPPYRVQGISIAGEETVVQIPELDVAFDIGLCPRVALSSSYIALSHGHMDHVAGLPYYFSQRMFQKMGQGTCICHMDLVRPLLNMMRSWVDVEQQRTPHNIVGLAPDDQFEIKNNIYLRAIEMSHTVPALGYAVIERRSKLREEYRDLPQESLEPARPEEPGRGDHENAGNTADCVHRRHGPEPRPVPGRVRQGEDRDLGMHVSGRGAPFTCERGQAHAHPGHREPARRVGGGGGGAVPPLAAHESDRGSRGAGPVRGRGT